VIIITFQRALVPVFTYNSGGRCITSRFCCAPPSNFIHVVLIAIDVHVHITSVSLPHWSLMSAVQAIIMRMPRSKRRRRRRRRMRVDTFASATATCSGSIGRNDNISAGSVVRAGRRRIRIGTGRSRRQRDPCMVMRCRSSNSVILAVMSCKLKVLCHVAGLTNGSKPV